MPRYFIIGPGIQKRADHKEIFGITTEGKTSQFDKAKASIKSELVKKSHYVYPTQAAAVEGIEVFKHVNKTWPNTYFCILEIEIPDELVAKLSQNELDDELKEENVAFILPGEDITAVSFRTSYLPATEAAARRQSKGGIELEIMSQTPGKSKGNARGAAEILDISSPIKRKDHQNPDSEEQDDELTSLQEDEFSEEFDIGGSIEKNPDYSPFNTPVTPTMIATSSPLSQPQQTPISPQPATPDVKTTTNTPGGLAPQASSKPPAAAKKDNMERLWRLLALGTTAIGVAVAYYKSTYVSGLLSIAADSAGLNVNGSAADLATKLAVYGAAGVGGLAVCGAACFILDRALTAFQQWRIKRKAEGYTTDVRRANASLEGDLLTFTRAESENPSLKGAKASELVKELIKIADQAPLAKFKGTKATVPADDRLSLLTWGHKKLAKLKAKADAPIAEGSQEPEATFAKDNNVSEYAQKILRGARAKLH